MRVARKRNRAETHCAGTVPNLAREGGNLWDTL